MAHRAAVFLLSCEPKGVRLIFGVVVEATYSGIRAKIRADTFAIYKYVFYLLYRWSRRINPEGDWHVFNAVLMLSTIMLLNIATLPPLLQLLLGPQTVDMGALAGRPLIGPGAAVVITAINYLILGHFFRFEDVVDDFDTEIYRTSKWKFRLAVAYIVGSPIGVVAVWYLAVTQT